MNKEEIQRYAAMSLDMPEDLLSGVPRIIITGNRSVLVENHRGILSFDGEEVRIACIYGELVITGSGLCLCFLKKDEIEAEGEISAVFFRSGEETPL